MRKKSFSFTFFCLLVLIATFFIGCDASSDKDKKPCEHQYSITTKSPTCTEKGNAVYTCYLCGYSYTEDIPALGHLAGPAATVDGPCLCSRCGAVLQEKVPYSYYDGKDTALNHYYNNSDGFYANFIDTQFHAKEKLNAVYYNSAGEEVFLHQELALQSYFNHDIYSVAPLQTNDGKTYNTTLGFKIRFQFALSDTNIYDLNAVRQGDFLTRFDDDALIKTVSGIKTGNIFDSVNIAVDFSDSVIEVAKNNNGSYETVKTISSNEEWEEVLSQGYAELTDENGRIFTEPGEYRVMFRYNVAWIANPQEKLYNTAEDAKEQVNGVYPYDFFNDQYDLFYVNIEDDRAGVLLPDRQESANSDYFYQLRPKEYNGESFFIDTGAMLDLTQDDSFYIETMLNFANGSCYYKDRRLKSFTMTLYYRETSFTSFNEYTTIDLIPLFNGNPVALLSFGKDVKLKGRECKMRVSYTFEGDGSESNTYDVYYVTMNW